jgi:hypothetical protein
MSPRVGVAFGFFYDGVGGKKGRQTPENGFRFSRGVCHFPLIVVNLLLTWKLFYVTIIFCPYQTLEKTKNIL